MLRILPSILLAMSVRYAADARLSSDPAPPVGEPAAFTITNDDETPTAPRIVSFGQVFARGDLLPGQTPLVRLDGRETAAQLDAKALYPDGSVRHGIVSVAVPALPAHRGLGGVILPASTTTQPPPAATPADVPPLVARLTFRSGPDAGRTTSFDLRTIARAPPRDPAWLSGPLVREQRYWSAAVDGVQLAFDVWTPRQGPARVDVIFHNDLAQNAAIATQRYDVDLSLAGRSAYRAANVRHYPYALWRRTIHADGRAPPRITPDTARLARLGATPNYLRIAPDDEAALRLHQAAVADETNPLPVAGVTPYMPTGGGRADIGPLPTWAVFYLLDPSRQNQETLLADADAAGSIPWHLRDGTSDGPISIDQHPDFWLDERGVAPPGLLGRAYRLPDTPWFPDTAHQPSLAYLPYLLTGSQFYRDELTAEAAYTLLSIDPQYRGGGAGVVIGQQVRALAWTLRTLATAAYALPANDPWQSYFQAKLESNLSQLTLRYVDRDTAADDGELDGFLPGPYAVEGAVAPWQSDYGAMVLAWLQDMGFQQARPILAWMANFTAGRFTSAARGYDPLYGTPYYLYVVDPASHAPIRRWSDAFRATFDPKAKPIHTLQNPDSAGDYAALARGALTSIVNATNSAPAREALAYVERQTRGMEANYPRDPTFAIALRGRAGS